MRRLRASMRVPWSTWRKEIERIVITKNHNIEKKLAMCRKLLEKSMKLT